MTPNELRIGNTLLNNGKPFNVDNHDIGYIDRNPDNKLWSPIPLTEEWLIKFGFEKVKNVNENTYPDFRKRSVELLKNVNGFYVLHRNEGFTDIHYVHQLQNLYFALTGEELTIKTK